ncbi:MAG: response regulator [Anaerolineales bacterium]
MSKARILVVEDDLDIANMLRIYFTGQGYEVSLASRGAEALELTRQSFPNLIVLDIMLPDIDGYTVCRELRTGARTKHIPIIFLTQKDERSDRIAGLELGADDYITKPFDIEELRLRVSNAITRAQRESLTDPRTGLPASRMIEEQLRELLRRPDWALLDCNINHFDPYREVYGFLAADEVLRTTAMVLTEWIESHGTAEDFVGHAGGESFYVITSFEQAPAIIQLLKDAFEERSQSFYTETDRDRGFLLYDRHAEHDRQAPFMSLSVGLLTDRDGPFADIDSLIETVSARRRHDANAAPA